MKKKIIMWVNQKLKSLITQLRMDCPTMRSKAFLKMKTEIFGSEQALVFLFLMLKQRRSLTIGAEDGLTSWFV